MQMVRHKLTSYILYVSQQWRERETAAVFIIFLSVTSVSLNFKYEYPIIRLREKYTLRILT